MMVASRGAALGLGELKLQSVTQISCCRPQLLFPQGHISAAHPSLTLLSTIIHNTSADGHTETSARTIGLNATSDFSPARSLIIYFYSILFNSTVF